MDELLIKFRALFPEFQNVSDVVVLLYIEMAGKIFCACTTAQLYLAAHLLTLDDANGVGQNGGSVGGSLDGGNGEVTNERVGELEVTTKAMADKGADTYYTTTPYGRRYIVLRNACPAYVFSARTFPTLPNYRRV